MLKDRLVELRKDLGLSQEEVADKLNIGRSTYANYEAGRTEPNISILKDLSKIYNVSIDYICENTDIMNSYYKDKRLSKYINKCIKLYNEFLKD